jgi:ATPase subunit of ABC transporter with duplicated ATPase domains
VGEQICSDFGQYFKDLEQEGRCLFLPFQILSLKVKNTGKFTERTFEFDRGLTVVFGYNGAGKTTLVKAIASVSGDHRLLKSGQNHGEINVTLSDGREILNQSLDDARAPRCVVLDESGEQLDKNHYEKFFKIVKNYKLKEKDMEEALKLGIGMFYGYFPLSTGFTLFYSPTLEYITYIKKIAELK